MVIHNKPRQVQSEKIIQYFIKFGRCLLWDYTCSDTLAPSYVENSAKSPGYVAKEGEERKFKHSEHLANEYEFIPISIETFGTWGV